MFSIPFRTPAHASSVVGLDLFSEHESFLQDLTENCESRISGGFRRDTPTPNDTPGPTRPRRRRRRRCRRS